MKVVIVQYLSELEFMIVYQSHVEGDFNNGKAFNEKDFWIQSHAFPEMYKDGMYLLGDEKGWENKVWKSQGCAWKKKFLETIKSYNEYHR
jgi:hypothetical protein